MLVCLVHTTFLHAQETRGTSRGKITDTAGHVLEGVTVTALHIPTGTPYTTKTSRDGRYNLPGLLVGGPYRLSVTSVGSVSQQQDNLQVSLGEAQTINFSLKAEVLVLTDVTVRAVRRPQANKTGAGANISGEQIANMPTISRSITDMTKLVPQGSKDNSFAGSNFRYNNVTVDGAINNDAIGFSPSMGGIVGTSNMPGSSTRSNPISMDAIHDMQVYLAPYDVTIGNFTGGSINVVTRSGTNKLEGSVYAYGRNAAVTGGERAGDGSKMPSSFHDYQVGYRVGFPLIPNKLFFFSNEEIARRVDPIQQGAASPDAASILSLKDAQAIHDAVVNRYGFDPGTYGNFNAYANSNKFFNRICHRIIANVSWRLPWHDTWATTFALFANLQSGAPYTYGFINYTVQNDTQQVSLAYIPNASEVINFFQDIKDEAGTVVQSAEAQAKAFNAYIDQNKYLNSRRGRFTERNAARTPWNNDLDFHFAHEFGIAPHKGMKATHTITFSWDILNLTNLLSKNWGWVYFSPNTYNSMSSVGSIPFIPAVSSQGYPIYTWQNPGRPYSVDYASSRWQMQMGLRYSF